MYAVHDAMDNAVLEPAARGYRAVTPKPLRTGVVNFLRNLRSPMIFANDLLQGEFERAGVAAVRFGLNTTVGLGGILDPASGLGFERHDEDFGQTLAVWGVDSGPYLFVPLMGPTTVRDAGGRVVDTALDPITYARGEAAETFRIVRPIVAGIATRELLLETLDDIEASTLDPYVAIRASYGLLRESAIQNGRTDVQDLPEFDEIDEQSAIEAPDTGANSQQTASIEPSSSSDSFSDALAAPTSAAVNTGEPQ